VYAINQWRM